MNLKKLWEKIEMKGFIGLVFIFSTYGVNACPHQVDPNKVMLFVDTNNSEPEIATTIKAACARGERLVIVPKNHKEFAKYNDDVEKKTKTFVQLGCKKKSNPKCKAAWSALDAAFVSRDSFQKSQPNITESVKNSLNEIKESKAKLQQVSISGHNGGGSFGGKKGSFSRQSLSQIMSDFKDMNEVKSILLLGCYTGTKHEVIEWKNIFPDARIIAGYDEKAPLADRPPGHQYISDILLKEKGLITSADQKRLNTFVQENLNGLHSLNAAVYLQCSNPADPREYYYSSKISRSFEPMDSKECEKKKEEIEKILSQTNKYLSGDLEPPLNTDGELRKIYNQARALEHCNNLNGIQMNLSQIFNLLFYEGVKQSFSTFYKDDLQTVEQYLSFNIEEMEKILNNSVLPENEKFASSRSAFEQLKTDLKDPSKRVWVPNGPNLAKYGRKELLLNLHRINELLALPVLNKKQRRALAWINTVTSQHLEYFQNPFSWHELTVPVAAPEAIHKLENFMNPRPTTSGVLRTESGESHSGNGDELEINRLIWDNN